MSFEEWSQYLWNHVELFQIELIPGNHGVRLQTRLSLFAGFVNGFINLLQLARRGIRDDLGPGFVGLTKRHGIRVTRTAVPTQSLVGHFRNVWASHHDWHTCGADSVGHAIGSGNHSGHRANANQPDLLLTYEVYQLLLVHWPRVAVN